MMTYDDMRGRLEVLAGASYWEGDDLLPPERTLIETTLALTKAVVDVVGCEYPCVFPTYASTFDPPACGLGLLWRTPTRSITLTIAPDGSEHERQVVDLELRTVVKDPMTSPLHEWLSSSL
jgi:hypothetical protein